MIAKIMISLVLIAILGALVYPYINKSYATPALLI
jgi:hypothetical protein